MQNFKYDHDAANDAAVFFGLGDWYFLSPEEQEQQHAEKLARPSSGEQARDARKRNLERAAKRAQNKSDNKEAI